MSKQFTLKNPAKMGDKDPKYGQSWWSYTHDADTPVMFNLMDGEVRDGSVITTEEWVNKQSSKGTDYLRLKKVKVQGQESLGEVRASTADVKPAYKDNSDGQRQGMCFNNANAYISALSSEKMPAEKWADIVWEYANALYAKGDLSGSDGSTTSQLPTQAEKPQQAALPKEDVVVMDIGDEPINLEDIPFS
jgi:hypothetical protein